ncbi:PEGA domain-containing protein [Halomonas mongoliensis]|uniref:PEGA domain-containing protein n=1 Tax=Halomonas mongoliensis TaxID=321265 RepID=UPI00403AC013
MKRLKLAAALAAAMTMTGCATIVGDKEQSISINSTPSQAKVLITDESSREVYAGETPTTVQLRKSDGSYFGGKTYTVQISKEGYQERSLTIDSRPNGWYIGGNLVFGGVIGWLIVDPLTGAMYNLSPDQINASLGDSVANNAAGEQEINLVLIEDVPSELHGEMQLLGQL